MDAVGTRTFWGLSPAVDMTELHRSVCGKHDAGSTATAAAATEPKGHSFLLVHSGDPRHFLKTLSRRLRADNGPAEVFMWEPSAEALVRNLVLVAIALDWSIPVRQRAHMFLEVFGNIRVRDKTARYLDSVRDDIINLVCNREGRLTDCVDPSHLSYRDVDDVEAVSKTLGYAVPFDMDRMWDQRLRHHYADRFDFRANVVDWDFHQHVRPVAGLVHPVLFRQWRATGLAFEFGDETYTAPNRTLAAYTEGRERGLSKLVRGFWGDVVCSPYWAWGTAAEVPRLGETTAAGHRAAASLFDVNNRHSGAEQFRHNAAEVSVAGVLALLSEIETGARYTMARPHDIYSGLGEAAGAAEAGVEAMDGAEVLKPPGSDEAAAADDAKARADEAADAVNAMPMAPERAAERRRLALLARSVRRSRRAAAALASVRLVPMLGDLAKALRRAKHRGRFDAVMLGCRAAQVLESPALASSLRPRAVVSLESARNLVVFKPYQKDEFERRALLLAGSAGMVYVGSERSLLRSDRLAVGSVLDVRAKAAVKAEADARAAARAEDEALRPTLGEHADGVLYLRSLAKWNARRGDSPRPESLVFAFDEGRAADRRAAMETGPAGDAVRSSLLQTAAEREAEEEAARLAHRAELRAERGEEAEARPAEPAGKPKRVGAGAAWARGGLGKTSRPLQAASGAGEPATDGATGAAAGVSDAETATGAAGAGTEARATDLD